MTRAHATLGGIFALLLGTTLAIGAKHHGTDEADEASEADEAKEHDRADEHDKIDEHHEHHERANKPGHQGDLKTIMVALGQDMDVVNAALWTEDWSALAAASQAIAEHPHVSAAEKTRIAAALGEDFAAFVKADHRVHDGAAGLAGAATARNTSEVLAGLAELQSGCVGCHDSFRDRLKQP